MKATFCRLFLLSVLLAGAPLAAQEAPAENTAAPAAASAPAQGGAEKIIVPEGTKLPLVLHNAITTRNAKAGDPVYFETIFPVVQDGRIVVPAGTYVQGEVIEAHRPGRVKGTGELRIRLVTMIMSNGYTARFDAVPSNAGTGGNETTGREGEIKGDTDKGTDAGTIIKTTGIGAGIGGIATRSGTGAGIGAGAGAAAGLATVLLTRGPEVELPRGTTLDAVLDRPLVLDASKINFSDPGRASSMSGPPNRQPVRSRSPF
jgi:type IV secretion system protein VirB10